MNAEELNMIFNLTEENADLKARLLDCQVQLEALERAEPDYVIEVHHFTHEEA